MALSNVGHDIQDRVYEAEHQVPLVLPPAPPSLTTRIADGWGWVQPKLATFVREWVPPIWRFGVKMFKLGISVSLDILDFTVGRILGFGIGFDLGCALITAALWGKRGWWCLWEVADITEQFDGFMPTCTIIALRSWNEA